MNTLQYQRHGHIRYHISPVVLAARMQIGAYSSCGNGNGNDFGNGARSSCGNGNDFGMPAPMAAAPPPPPPPPPPRQSRKQPQVQGVQQQELARLAKRPRTGAGNAPAWTADQIDQTLPPPLTEELQQQQQQQHQQQQKQQGQARQERPQQEQREEEQKHHPQQPTLVAMSDEVRHDDIDKKSPSTRVAPWKLKNIAPKEEGLAVHAAEAPGSPCTPPNAQGSPCTPPKPQAPATAAEEGGVKDFAAKVGDDDESEEIPVLPGSSDSDSDSIPAPPARTGPRQLLPPLPKLMRPVGGTAIPPVALTVKPSTVPAVPLVVAPSTVPAVPPSTVFVPPPMPGIPQFSVAVSHGAAGSFTIYVRHGDTSMSMSVQTGANRHQ